MKNTTTRNIIIAAAVVFAAFVAVATIDTRPSGVVAASSYDSLSGEHALTTAYSVFRDYNQCLRTIPNSSFWTPEAYEIELVACCNELLQGKRLVDHILGFEYAVFADLLARACPVDAEESSISPPPSPESRRQAKIDALMAQPERFD